MEHEMENQMETECREGPFGIVVGLLRDPMFDGSIAGWVGLRG